MDSGHHHLRFSAQERSYLAILKKDIHALARAAGFSDAKVANIDIVVAEVSSNLVKHAKDGELLVRVNAHCLELIGIDSGPGIGNMRLMTQDGISTTSTLGHGLGAIRRLSDDCDMYSQKGWGTITLARFYKVDRPFYRKKPPVDIHYLITPKPGERACGDGAAFSLSKSHVKIMLGDGLGHGPDAQAVVSKAEASFMSAAAEETSAIALLRAVHDGVKRSRGLVATVGVFDFAEAVWRICGVGNVASWIGNARNSRNAMSYNGIVGVNMPNTLNEYVVPHEYGQILVLCSDGIRTRWDFTKYPFILKHDLSILAAAIYKDFARKTDDMSVFIARINKQ